MSTDAQNPDATTPSLESDASNYSRRDFTKAGAAALGGGALGAGTLGAAAPAAGQDAGDAGSQATVPAARASDYHGNITPSNAAALFIDHQTQLMLGCKSRDTEEIENNTLAVAHLAEMYDLPVVLTTTGGGAQGPAGPLFPELPKRFPDQEVIDRQAHFDAMKDPRFVEAVEATGRQKLIITGITTDLCVVFPALTAVAMGYDVYVVADACASWNEEIDRIALDRIRQGGGIVTNMQGLAAEIQTNLAAEDMEAAKAKHEELLEFYGEYVGPTSLMNAFYFLDKSEG